ncbi:hypothetical protein OE88DRAFT_1661445 [Heliocybe sulcata]|uniref:Uncharacterized protein n=1 Tax=Heliocybe sulcata TaxID=5364 RepID=A0A5C3MYW5_9AGAM|nr:hypothetical protein OE88DRAFT_1661445 [Heliocybe sulcata]
MLGFSYDESQRQEAYWRAREWHDWPAPIVCGLVDKFQQAWMSNRACSGILIQETV